MNIIKLQLNSSAKLHILKRLCPSAHHKQIRCYVRSTINEKTPKYLYETQSPLLYTSSKEHSLIKSSLSRITNVSRLSTSSRQNNYKNEENKDKNNTNFDKTLIYMAISLLLFDFVFFNFYYHFRDQSYTVTWPDFARRVLPTGEVDKIYVSSQDVAIAKLHQDSVYIQGERQRRQSSEPRLIVLQGGFEMGVVLEKLVRAEEKKMNIDPVDSLKVEFAAEKVTKEKDNIVSAERWDGLKNLVWMGNGLVVAFMIAMKFQTMSNKNSMFYQIYKNLTSKNNKLKQDMKSDPQNVVSSQATRNKDTVKLADVAGVSEAKQEVTEFIHFLKDHSQYTALGAKMPRGCLLTGPPGCGKTLMARAIANEAGVPFIVKSGSDFVEMLGGLGAKRVRELFAEARKKSPCIIFIDEIDAIGASRENDVMTASREKSQTLNQLLVEMDGMLSKKFEVVVMAATNRADILDKALLRPGRFDRTIQIDLPTLKDRQDILEVHLSKIKLENEPIDYSPKLAYMTPGMSGAELANICNEAAIYAARIGDNQITMKHLTYAIDRVIAGAPKSSTSVSPQERRVVAVHEAGHVIVGWMLKHCDALAKVTIVPRTKGALGFAQNNPTERMLYSPEEIMDIMCMALGGRAAEELVFKKITNGAQDDLRKVSAMAYAQVKHFGFSEAVGEISFPQQQSGFAVRPYSDALAKLIDQESSKLVKTAYDRTKKLLKDNEGHLVKLSEELFNRETLDYDDVSELIGQPPHGDKRQVQEMPMAPMAKDEKEK